MAKKIKHCVFVLDQTGSMYNIKTDTIGGFNQFLKKQKKINKYNIKFSLILFNSDKVEKRYIAVDVSKVKPLSDKNYVPNSTTPLWDAIGMAISENDKKKNVFFVVLTDGWENASKEFGAEKIKEMIKKKNKVGWGFEYLGVGLEKFNDGFIGSAVAMGIGASSASTFPTTSVKHNLSVNLTRSSSNYYDTGKVSQKRK